MTNRKLVAFFLAAGGLLAAAPAANAADPRPSHRPISATEPDGDGQLERRLRPAQDLALLRNLAKKLLSDPKQLNKLSDRNKELLRKLLEDKNFQDLLRDPQVAEQLSRELRDNPNLTREQLEMLRKSVDQIPPGELEKLAKQAAENPRDFNLNPEQARELEQLAKAMREGHLPERSKADLAKLLNQMRDNPNVQRGDLDALKRALPGIPPPPPITPGGPPEPPPGILDPPQVRPEPVAPPPGPDQPGPQPQGPTKPDTTANDTLVEAIVKLVDWVQDFDPEGSVLGSTADWLRGLLTDDGTDRWGQTTDLLGSLGQLRDWLPAAERVQAAGSWLEQLSPPQAPSVSAPSAPSLPGAAAPSFGADAPEELARLVIWGIMLAGLAVVAWKLTKMYREAAGGRAAGRWPVEPGAVATRGDLVRAFEYLALRLLGLDARHRHHLDLADRLGGPAEGGDWGRRRAAGHLAHLYELARYAPADEPLPEAEMAAARRDLSFLAGAAPA
jgi:hypothetical protein